MSSRLKGPKNFFKTVWQKNRIFIAVSGPSLLAFLVIFLNTKNFASLFLTIRPLNR